MITSFKPFWMVVFSASESSPTKKLPVCGVNQVPYESRNQSLTSVSLVPS